MIVIRLIVFHFITPLLHAFMKRWHNAHITSPNDYLGLLISSTPNTLSVNAIEC